MTGCASSIQSNAGQSSAIRPPSSGASGRKATPTSSRPPARRLNASPSQVWIPKFSGPMTGGRASRSGPSPEVNGSRSPWMSSGGTA